MNQSKSCMDQAMSPMDCVQEGLKPLSGGFAARRHNRTTSPEINQNPGRDSSKLAFYPNTRCSPQSCRDNCAPDATSCRFTSSVKGRSFSTSIEFLLRPDLLPSLRDGIFSFVIYRWFRLTAKPPANGFSPSRTFLKASFTNSDANSERLLRQIGCGVLSMN